MADAASLKRLGGGRWQSRDGRFTIEPQSGTWVVVDSQRANELGLPLVRGPFPSLTAARADIETARSEGAADSPLASRLAATPKRATRAGKRAAGSASRRSAPSEHDEASKTGEPGTPDEELEEPAWLRSLDGPPRNAARRLIGRLTDEGVEDAEGLVRSDIVGGQPALARLAITRRIADAVGKRRDPDTVAEAVTHALLQGQDRDLGVRWRLVDGEGRVIARLERGAAKRR